MANGVNEKQRDLSKWAALIFALLTQFAISIWGAATINTKVDVNSKTLSRIEMKQDELSGVLQNHIIQPWHGAMDQRVRAIEKAMEKQK